jgi:hypothetical protein
MATLHGGVQFIHKRAYLATLFFWVPAPSPFVNIPRLRGVRQIVDVTGMK